MTTRSATRSTAEDFDLAELLGQVLNQFQTNADKIDGSFVLKQCIRTYVSREFGISAAQASLVVAILEAMGLLGVVNLTTYASGFMSEHQVLGLMEREHDLVVSVMTRQNRLYWVGMDEDIISPDMFAHMTLPTSSDKAAQRATILAAYKEWRRNVAFEKFRKSEIARLENEVRAGACRVAKAGLAVELTEIRLADQLVKQNRKRATLAEKRGQLELLLEM